MHLKSLINTSLFENQRRLDRKSTRLNSSHSQISYAVFCLKKKKKHNINNDLNSQEKSAHSALAPTDSHVRTRQCQHHHRHYEQSATSQNRRTTATMRSEMN